MGLLSNKIDREKLKPGDHIYSWRNVYLYAHHGIYVGEGKVIHFTRAAGREIGTGTVLDRFIFSSSPSHSSENPCPNCDDPSGRDAGVMSSCLDCFLSGGDLYLFEYGVNPALFIAKARGGTCTLASSDPSEDVLSPCFFPSSEWFLATTVFSRTTVKTLQFIAKTGLLVFTSLSVGRSGQAASIFSVASAIACSPARYLTTTVSVKSEVATEMVKQD
ncbi:hypothetical protein M0R45_006066 [Rubus argutus]|uniref:LRAT domain-containing protein n=1 Tax=Rubus argutus TaxID=59490 RepID=A0AAW1YPD0_RUBAR